MSEPQRRMTDGHLLQTNSNCLLSRLGSSEKLSEVQATLDQWTKMIVAEGIMFVNP